MEAKLKLLKVADLKDILTRAGVPCGRANKNDLINKILESEAAIKVYNDIHGPVPAENAPAVPSSISDKSKASPPQKAVPPPSSSQLAKIPQPPSSPPKPASKAVPAAAVTTASESKSHETPSTGASASTSSEDQEAERRKARAARFGIPVVELQPNQQVLKNGKAVVNGKATNGIAAADAEKLAVRAERFGTQTPPEQTKGWGRKRLAPAEPVDEEELARRKRRAERFGIPLVGA